MNTKKWLYFRNVTDVDSDDGIEASTSRSTSVMIPAENLMSMQPHNDTGLTVTFKPVKHLKSGDGHLGTGRPSRDRVLLTIAANTHESVMQSITEAISAPNGNTFIDVVDIVTTLVDESTRIASKINSNITTCSTIELNKTPKGSGIHQYYEMVRLATDDSGNADNKSVGELKVKLPAHCILLEAGMIVEALGTKNAGTVKLNYHTATTADGATAGTEWVGAGAASDTSIPDADLTVGSSGTVGDTVHSGTFVPVDTAANETFITVVACTDFTQDSDTDSTGVVGVYVKWFGAGAIAL